MNLRAASGHVRDSAVLLALESIPCSVTPWKHLFGSPVRPATKSVSERVGNSARRSPSSGK